MMPVCAALASLAAGCAVGPNFRAPPSPASAYAPPPASVGPQALSFGGDTAGDWYTVFHSDSLNRLVHEAIRANPDLEAARHSLGAAQYELRAVAGALLPQIQVNGAVARVHANGTTQLEPAEKLQPTANVFALVPSLEYDLDVFGGIRRSVESQAAQTQSVRHRSLNLYLTIVEEVVVTAFAYVATVAQLEVTRALVADLQSQYELTSLLERSGKIAATDTLQAKAQLEATRATIPALEKQRDVYRIALLKLTGKAPQEDALPELALRDFALPRQLPVSLPSVLVRQRPDILEAEDLLHQSSAQIGVAEAARLPSFQILGAYGQVSIMGSDFFTHPAGVWAAGLGMTAPVFEGGRLRAREQEARERFVEAEAEYRSTVLGAFSEVADALQALQHDSDSYLAHEAALAAARASRDLARTQFEHGLVNELTVLTAEQQFQNAALSEVQADVQRFTDSAELIRALGGGWWNTAAAAGGLPTHDH
jgi:NodT family efflux transporter outer membrane factor (OMF) lipoprotein